MHIKTKTNTELGGTLIDIFVKTVFFHQNIIKISFYEFFMVNYDYLIETNFMFNDISFFYKVPLAVLFYGLEICPRDVVTKCHFKIFLILLRLHSDVS